MKKYVTLVLGLIFCAFGAVANDTITVVAEPVAISAISDSLAVDSAENDSLTVDSLTLDSLEMSVLAPVLEWDVVGSSNVRVKPNYIFVPLIFEEYPATDMYETKKDAADVYLSGLAFNVKKDWLDNSISDRESVAKLRFETIVARPQDVQYNEKDLPEPPKSYVLVTDPSKRTVAIEERSFDNMPSVQGDKIKIKKWLHSFDASVQVSQAYLSENWYQGGENNVNVLGNVVWSVKLNPNVYKNLLFENSVQYKVSLNSASQDTIRGYSISQDLFQVNTKFGYKAIKNWYYSTSLRFKTQLLNNYVANTNNLTASVLSPADLNLGVGMTYNTTTKKKKIKVDLSLAPLSMDMKICREIKKIDPTSFGISEGKHIKTKYGSNLEAKISWNVTREITWSSRLFAFSNYEYIEGDWENTLNFSINKYLSTKIYAHLRYDNSVSKHKNWKYWQFNEILSFGFNYKFTMNK